MFGGQQPVIYKVIAGADVVLGLLLLGLGLLGGGSWSLIIAGVAILLLAPWVLYSARNVRR